jgi:hypothetical protein
MAKEDIVLVLENIGGVDEDIYMLNKNPTTNLSNVENVHLQCDNNLVENDELHLGVITTQVHIW